jgi:glycosyltransferase involved in cell wall biosynthesis
MVKHSTLTILPGLRIKTLPGNQIIITRKFIEAVLKYKSLWGDRIKVLIEEDPRGIDDVDQKAINRDELPFELEVLSYDDRSFAEHLQNSVVLGVVGYRQNHISKLCRSIGVPCVYTAEYTLETRQQILSVTTKNRAKQLRKYWWEYNQEQKQQRAVALADGLQCNGYPIFEAYRMLNPNPMLFLDTRITEEMMATQADVEQRAQCRANDAPLQLVFSGRLNQMKGADHLLDVALELKRLGVRFHLYISGSGVLEEPMQRRIYQENLGDEVTMLGVPDFESEFFPFVKSNIDLFICCHRQGDPSCTYIETMSAGVPIVGYANEACARILHHSRGGWIVPLNNPQLLARKVAELDRDREHIKTKALAAQRFAQFHTFTETFRCRVEHLQEVALDVAVRQPNQLSLSNFRPEIA